MESAFTTICECISKACMFTIPFPEDVMSVVTDASGLGIGGVLQVKRRDEWEATALYSWQTRGAEQCYSATELEVLVLVDTIRHFAYYLYGKCYTAYTDHKPLCQLLSSDQLNGRFRRMSMKLQHWLVTVKYLPSEKNSLADALSREERTRQKETEVKEGLQSGVGGCGGTPHEVVPAWEIKLRSTRDEENMTK